MKKLNLIFLVLVFGLLALPMLSMPFFKDQESAEKREMAPFPSVMKDGALNSRFAGDLDDYVRDHIGFRNQMVEGNTVLLAKLFKESAEDDVILGENGWLYYEGTANDYLNIPTMTERAAKNAAHSLKMLQDFAGEHGISYEGIASPKGEDTAKEWDVSVRTTDLEEQEPRYEAIFRDENGKTIQVAEGHTVDYPKDMLKPFGNVWQADVNFDGYTDIMICLGMMPASDQVITYYDAWLYNPQTGKFGHHKGFRDIANPEVDNVNKHVIAHYLLRDGKNKHYTAFVLQNDGTQKLVKEWDGK